MTNYSPRTNNTVCARERVLSTGPSSLSDAELISAVLGPHENAFLSQTAALALLDRIPLSELAWASPTRLSAEAKTDPLQAAALSAAFELGRRAAWRPPRRGDPCLSAGTIYELMRHVAFQPVEEFHTVLLDTRGRLMSTHLIARGTVNQCAVSPIDALRPAIQEGAYRIVFVHSHPGGDPSPSPEDFSLTDHLISASELIGLRPVDHVIVSAKGLYSFVEAGTWPVSANR